MLSPHFAEVEFRSHDGAPTPQPWLNEMRDLCERHLEPLRRRFGPTHVLSGHRSKRRNEEVGGATRSRHLNLRGRQGAAADLRCERGTPREWYDFLDARGVGGLGLYSWGVHVDNRPGPKARWTG